MTKPTTTQKKEAEKKKWLDIKMAAEKAASDTLDLKPLLQPEGPSLDEEDDKDASAPDELYVLEKNPKKKEAEEEYELVTELSICWNGECIPVDMSWDEAQDFCDRANQLLNNNHPEDRESVERAWDLLRKGQYDESRDELNKGLKAAESRGSKWGPLPSNTPKKNEGEDDEKMAAPKA
jgi:hypothetical protein